MTSSTIRIVIADDHAIVRDGLKRLLDSEPGFCVIGEASDGIEAVRLAHELVPDVLLLDVAMPRLDGLTALTSLTAVPTRVVLLTAAIDAPDLLRALQLGAQGVVLKESATALLIAGIRQVMDGKYLVGAEIANTLAQALSDVRSPAASRYGLTARELEIVAAILSGESNKIIAERLGISLQTVKHHLTSIFDKTGSSTRLELALFALKFELLETSGLTSRR